MPKVKSKAQAGFLGAVAGGKSYKKPAGLSRAEAKEMLRGSKQKRLPSKKKGKKKK